MICYSRANGSPADDASSNQRGPNLSTTGFFQHVLDEIDLAHPDHAISATRHLREMVAAEEIFDRLISEKPSDQVNLLVNAAAGLSPKQPLSSDLRKELLSLLIDTAGTCAERELIEPQIRFGRILHAISVTTMDAGVADLIQTGLRDRKILFDQSLQRYSPTQFETEIKFSPGDHDYRGFTSGRGALVYVDSLVSVGNPEDDIIETSAIFSGRIPDARAVIGYRIEITSSDGQVFGLDLNSTNRSVVKNIHARAVEFDRRVGIDTAKSYLSDISKQLLAA